MLALHTVEHKRRAHHTGDSKQDHNSNGAGLIGIDAAMHRLAVHHPCEEQEEECQDGKDLQEALDEVLLVVDQRPLCQFSESADIKLYHNCYSVIMSKTSYYVLNLTFVDGVEQQFQVDLCLRTAGLARRYDGIALQRGFGIEHILHLVRRAILEGIFLLDLSY